MKICGIDRRIVNRGRNDCLKWKRSFFMHCAAYPMTKSKSGTIGKTWAFKTNSRNVVSKMSRIIKTRGGTAEFGTYNTKISSMNYY